MPQRGRGRELGSGSHQCRVGKGSRAGQSTVGASLGQELPHSPPQRMWKVRVSSSSPRELPVTSPSVPWSSYLVLLICLLHTRRAGWQLEAQHFSVVLLPTFPSSVLKRPPLPGVYVCKLASLLSGSYERQTFTTRGRGQLPPDL